MGKAEPAFLFFGKNYLVPHTFNHVIIAHTLKTLLNS